MARSGYFRLQLEGLPSDEVEWVDLSIFKRGGRIGTRPRFKPTSLAIPLGRDSARPMHAHEAWPAPVHAHEAWPAARLMHVQYLCPDRFLFQQCRAE
eukprot:9025683-Pyramimonas_sp.AAC.1